MGQNEWIRYPTSVQSQVGIYGWRKRCLYLLVLSLLLLVIVNLALTLWIIKVLEFDSVGMGGLKLVQQGVQLPDLVYILGYLITSTIYSHQPMKMESYDNITICTKNSVGKITNQLYLEEELLEMNIGMFKVTDKWNTTVFIVNKDEVVVGTYILPLNGIETPFGYTITRQFCSRREGGSTFEGKLQTSIVESEKKVLRLESPGGELEVCSVAGVSIQSRAGQINLTSGFDIELNSGSLKIDSSNVLLPGLKEIAGNSSTIVGIFQLCACDNGKLFLGRNNEQCARPEQSVFC